MPDNTLVVDLSRSPLPILREISRVVSLWYEEMYPGELAEECEGSYDRDGGLKRVLEVSRGRVFCRVAFKKERSRTSFLAFSLEVSFPNLDSGIRVDKTMSIEDFFAAEPFPKEIMIPMSPRNLEHFIVDKGYPKYREVLHKTKKFQKLRSVLQQNPERTLQWLVHPHNLLKEVAMMQVSSS